MKNWVLLLIVGILFVLAGIAALLNPFAASMTVSFIAGWSFIIVGVLQMIEAINAEGWGGKLWSLLLGVVSLLVGISLVANPLSGMVPLTIMLAANTVMLPFISSPEPPSMDFAYIRSSPPRNAATRSFMCLFIGVFFWGEGLLVV